MAGGSIEGEESRALEWVIHVPRPGEPGGAVPSFCVALWQVTRAYVHATDIPNTGGVDLPMTEIRHAHYRGIFHPNRPCSKPADTRPDLVKDTTVAEIAAKARGCDKGGFMDQVHRQTCCARQASRTPTHALEEMSNAGWSMLSGASVSVPPCQLFLDCRPSASQVLKSNHEAGLGTT